MNDRAGALRAILLCTSAALAMLAGPVRAWAQDAATAPSEAADADLPVFMPPDIDYASVCAESDRNRVNVGIDWTRWDGVGTDRSTDDLVSIASEYIVGSDRLAKDPATAERILDYLSTKRRVGTGIVNFLYGRIYVRRIGDPADLVKAEAFFQKSLKAGYSRAALALGQYYSTNGPIGTRDPVKAARYFQISSATGDPEGQIGLARLFGATPSKTPAEKRFQTLTSMVSLDAAIKTGRCFYIKQIADLYLRGNLVPQKSEVAIAWFEKAAALGDSVTAEVLGTLLSSTRVDNADYAKAYDYFQQAADDSRPYAALTIGKAFATGVGRDRDLAKAVKYLTIAGDKGMSEAYSWLGRLYSGEFGGTADPAKAMDSYKRVATSEKASAGDVSEYAARLLEAEDGSPELDEVTKKLQTLAFLGSDEAAYTLAEVYLKKAASDPTFYTQAERFLRLSAQNGKSDGARDLAHLYYCGAGVPMSAKLGNEWMERAAFLGSGRALYLLAVNERDSGEPGAVESANRIMQKAAMAASPDAIGYVVSRYEAGADGFAKDPEAARRMIDYVANIEDEEDRTNATIGILRGRYDVSTSREERAAILTELGGYADRGVVTAMVLRAGLLDDSGLATPAESREAYRLAAEHGDPRGMREFALRLLAKDTGEDGSDREQDGVDWLKKAAAAGDIYAAISLVDLSDPNASASLDRIAASGTVCTVDQMTTLARAYGQTTSDPGRQQAATWLERAKLMVGKDADQLFAIASLYWDGVLGPDQRRNAEPYLEAAGEAGRNTAFRDLAEGHIEGIWTDASPEKGKEILQRSAALGDTTARLRLLQEAAGGRVPMTYREVDDLLAEIGPSPEITGDSYLKLSRLSLEGRLGAVDRSKTAGYLTRSAELGNIGAMRRLNKAYLEGDGVQRSPEMAVEWLRKAADLGDTKAALELAAAYEVGFGVKRDLAEADQLRANAGKPAVR